MQPAQAVFHLFHPGIVIMFHPFPFASNLVTWEPLTYCIGLAALHIHITVVKALCLGKMNVIRNELSRKRRRYMAHVKSFIFWLQSITENSDWKEDVIMGMFGLSLLIRFPNFRTGILYRFNNLVWRTWNFANFPCLHCSNIPQVLHTNILIACQEPNIHILNEDINPRRMQLQKQVGKAAFIFLL